MLKRDPDKAPLQSLVLLGALFLTILLIPIAAESEQVGIIVRMIYLGVFCLGGYLLFRARRWVIIYVCLAVPALFLGILNEATANPVILTISKGLTVSLQMLLIVAVVRFALYHPGAGKLDRIIAGMCGYLILGLFWADLYEIFEFYFPGGFRLPDGTEMIKTNGNSIYFSFVTLTTLGYGDISPTNPWTKMLAAMQAFSGTMYIAVLISSLINRQNLSSD
jgi:hypothetical protein